MLNLTSRSVLGASSIYIVASAISAGVQVLLLPFLTHWLNPTEFGTYAIFGAISNFLGPLLGMSVHGSVANEYFKSPDNLSRYIGNSVVTIFLLSLATTLLVVLFQEPIDALFIVSAKLVLSAIPVAAGTSLLNLRLSLWQVSNHPFPYAFFQVANAALNGIMTVLFVLWDQNHLEGAIFANTLACTLGGVASLIFLKGANLLIFQTNLEDIRRLFRFGVPLLPHAIGQVSMNHLDRILIAAFINLQEVGYFTLARQISLLLQLVTENVNKAFVPWLYATLEDRTKTSRTKLVAFSYRYIAILILLAACLGFSIPKVLIVFFNPVYAPTAIHIPWMFLSIGFGGMYFAFCNYIFYAERTELISFATLLVALAAPGILYLCIRQFGAEGASIAKMTTSLFYALIVWWLAARVCPMPWLGYILRRTV